MDITGIMSLRTRKPKEKTKRKGTITNKTTSEIVKYMNLNGWASRINIVAIQRNGKYTSSNMALGIPDVIGCLDGLFISIEVKTGKDKLSENQIKCHSKIKEKGKGIVLVVKDFEDFLTQMNNLKL